MPISIDKNNRSITLGDTTYYNDPNYDYFQLINNYTNMLGISVPLRGGGITGEIDKNSLFSGYAWYNPNNPRVGLLVPNVNWNDHTLGIISGTQDPNTPPRNLRIRNEIASLLHDVGVLLHSQYRIGGTGAAMILIPSVLRNNFQYANVFFHRVSAESREVFRQEVLSRVNPNLDSGAPVILGTRTYTRDIIRNCTDECDEDCSEESHIEIHYRLGAHAFIVDGRSYLRYPYNQGDKVEYHHFNMGWGYHAFTRGFWFNLFNMPNMAITVDDSGIIIAPHPTPEGGLRPQFPFIDMVFNVMPKDSGELVSGRIRGVDGSSPSTLLYLELRDGPPLRNEALKYDPDSGEYVSKDGVFVFRIPSGRSASSPSTLSSSDITAAIFQGSGRFEGNALSFLIDARRQMSGSGIWGDNDHVIPVGTTYAEWHNINGVYRHITGNIFFGDVPDPFAVVTGANNTVTGRNTARTGTDSGLGVVASGRFDIPIPYADPATAAAYWDLSGLQVLYMDSFPYDTQPWVSDLFSKVRDFVRDGGVLYATGESFPIVEALAMAAGIGDLRFHRARPHNIRDSAGGWTELVLSGKLREQMGMPRVISRFVAYRNGDGPLGPTPDRIPRGINSLATGVILYLYHNPQLPHLLDVVERPHLVAFYFQYGEGTVYYSSFNIQHDVMQDIVNRRRLAEAMVSSPIAETEYTQVARAAGFSREETTFRDFSTMANIRGRNFNIPSRADDDLTVVVSATGTFLGPRNPSLNHDERQWTVSLRSPSGSVHQTRTSNSRSIIFTVPEEDNENGNWTVSVDDVQNLPDNQMVVVMASNRELDDDDEPVDVAVQGVTIAPGTSSLAVGATQQLTANIIPTNATNRNVTWSSANTNVATVDENGLVTAVSPGSSVISVTTADGGFTAQSTITVTGGVIIIPVESIAVTPTSLTLNQGNQGSLSVAFTPANATNRAVIWSTSNSAVATVNNGTVTAHGAGSAVITATSVDGSRTSTSTVTVTGGSGSDPRRERYEQRFPGHNIIFAPEGGGRVVGGPGYEVIVSGPGTGNWLEGGPGNTIYVYNRDADHDIIYNGQSVDGDVNELHFGPGIYPDDLVFYRENYDLRILVLDEIGDIGGSVTVKSWYLANRFRLARIVFYDGTSLTTEEIEALVTTRIIRGTELNQTLRTNSQPGERVRVYATAGINTLVGGHGIETFVFGTGTDTINARSSVEGGGQKTFVWNVNSGNVTINYLNAERQVAGDGLSILRFGRGVAPENVNVQISGNNVVFVVTLEGRERRITVNGARLDIRAQMDEIRFADGTVWTWNEAMERPRIVRGTERNETLRTLSLAGERVTLFATAGINSVFGGHGADTFMIGTGHDHIHARSHMEGGGQKTFVWNAGAGNVNIHYWNAERQVPGDGLSILRFGPGIAPEHINVQISGNNVVFVVTLEDRENAITISGARPDIRAQMDEIQFADGTVLTWSEVMARPRIVRGTTINQTLRTLSLAGESVILFSTAGTNSIFGGHGTDTFVIGTGHDHIHARSNMEGGGQKTFIWSVGAGNVNIHYWNAERQVEGDGLSILRFGPGIAPENIEVEISSNNVIFVVTVGDRENRITISGARPDIRAQMDEIQFADGTMLTWNEVMTRTRIVRGIAINQTLRTLSLAGESVMLFATAGTNSIFGGHGTDTFVIGTGHDHIHARSNLEGGGQKTFIWSVGAGNVNIHYWNAERQVEGDGLSILRFGPGIAPENIEVEISSNNVIFVVTVGDRENRITVTGARPDIRAQMDEIQFADGTVLTWNEVMARPRIVRGTAGNQTLRTLSLAGENVMLFSTAGANSVFGGHGTDTFVIGTGHDTIHARSNMEGGGRKTFIWNVGAGNAVIHYFNANRQVRGDGLSILQFGPGIAPENIDTQVSGNDVIFVVTVGGVERRITIAGARPDIGRQMDAIRFADGTVWDWYTILNSMVIRGADFSQTLRTNSLAGEMVTVFSNAGSNSIFGGHGTDNFVIGIGHDTIHARSNMEGGGRKTFIWNVGAGNVVIHYLNADRQETGDGLSILQFGSGIAPENIDVQVSGNDVIFVVTAGDRESRITISGSRLDIRRQMDEIRFADGTMLTWNDVLESRIVRGTMLNQTLRTNSLAGERVMLFSNAGTNSVFGGHGTDMFMIGAGTDTIHARSNMEGGGRKTFVWNIGAGNATIHYLNADRQEAGDRLSVMRFGPGIAPGNINIQFSGNNVIFVITAGGQERRITFMNARLDIRAQMDRIQFADRTSYTWSAFVGQ